MNRLAEAVKERTFKFALTSSELDDLLDESTQLARIFNQSQLTAKNNAIARRT